MLMIANQAFASFDTLGFKLETTFHLQLKSLRLDRSLHMQTSYKTYYIILA
jgi:hypothetical protein